MRNLLKSSVIGKPLKSIQSQSELKVSRPEKVSLESSEPVVSVPNTSAVTPVPSGGNKMPLIIAGIVLAFLLAKKFLF